MSVLAELIDKTDNFELIRDKIAVILANETANQQALATAAGEDPELWKFAVYTERANPWESLRADDDTPIVNVWFETSTAPKRTGNVVERQQVTGTFHVDCYCRGSAASSGSGHLAGDEQAARNVQRILRLVRNILMAAQNTYLQMRGVVWHRWPQSLTVFQPQMDARNVEQVIAARLTLAVDFNEFSPQVEGEALEILSVDVKRDSDGQIMAEADYSYPLP